MNVNVPLSSLLPVEAKADRARKLADAVVPRAQSELEKGRDGVQDASSEDEGCQREEVGSRNTVASGGTGIKSAPLSSGLV